MKRPGHGFVSSAVALGLLLTFVGPLAAFASPPAVNAPSVWRIPPTTTQLVVGIATTWESSEATLQRFIRRGRGWLAVGDPMPARLGAKGLVWGRGLSPRTNDMGDKSEGDDRSPAGVFRIGRSFGYDPAWKVRTKLRFTAVTKRDLFVEDPTSSLYNSYVHLDHDPVTPFETNQQMKQNDPAHRLKILIEHNTTPAPIAGRGSAILFHIWRSNGTMPTAGCTSAASSSIETLMTWLDPTKRPLYVLLPVDEYRTRAVGWGMPTVDPETLSTTFG